MAIDAAQIVAAVSTFAWCLFRNDTQRLKLFGRELPMVFVRTLVSSSSGEVAASDTNVVLVACLVLLDMLHVVAIVVLDFVDTLAFAVL